MTKKEWAIVGVLGAGVFGIMVVCVFAFLALVILSPYVVGSQSAVATKSPDLIKAEQLLPANTPHRDLILDEVRKGYLSALDIEIYQLDIGNNLNKQKHYAPA